MRFRDSQTLVFAITMLMGSSAGGVEQLTVLHDDLPRAALFLDLDPEAAGPAPADVPVGFRHASCVVDADGMPTVRWAWGVVGSGRYEVWQWRPRPEGDADVRRVLKGTAPGLRRTELSPRGRYWAVEAAVGRETFEVTLWDVELGQAVGSWRPPRQADDDGRARMSRVVHPFAFKPTPPVLFSSDESLLWMAATSRLHRLSQGPDGAAGADGADPRYRFASGVGLTLGDSGVLSTVVVRDRGPQVALEPVLVRWPGRGASPVAMGSARDLKGDAQELRRMEEGFRVDASSNVVEVWNVNDASERRFMAADWDVAAHVREGRLVIGYVEDPSADAPMVIGLAAEPGRDQPQAASLLVLYDVEGHPLGDVKVPAISSPNLVAARKLLLRDYRADRERLGKAASRAFRRRIHCVGGAGIAVVDLEQLRVFFVSATAAFRELVRHERPASAEAFFRGLRGEGDGQASPWLAANYSGKFSDAVFERWPDAVSSFFPGHEDLALDLNDLDSEDHYVRMHAEANLRAHLAACPDAISPTKLWLRRHAYASASFSRHAQRRVATLLVEANPGPPGLAHAKALRRRVACGAARGRVSQMP